MRHSPAALPLFPVPQQLQLYAQDFLLTADTVVVAPTDKRSDLLPAEHLAHALADATRIGIPIIAGEVPRGRRAIFVGSRRSADWFMREAGQLDVPAHSEAYALQISSQRISLVGSDAAGTLYGGATLLELLRRDNLSFRFQGASIRDWPDKPVRGVHLFIPGKEQLPFFKRYLERFLLRHKFNTLLLEVGGGMRLKSHPEVSAGWARTVEELYAHGEVTWRYGESAPLGPQNRFQDTTHRGVGYGEYIEADELSALCQLARRWNIRVIPEIQSLSHVYHIATPRRDVAELPQALFPDAYCPSNPESYRIVFDLIDEYIRVIGCDAVHIGHDEWRAGALCPRCRKHRSGQLFAQDVIKLWKHLDDRDCDLWMWGDHFVTKHNERPRSNNPQHKDGVWYNYPSSEGARAQVSRATRSRPLTITHWSWSMGQETDIQLLDAGFRIVYGNFQARKFHPDWAARSKGSQILGAQVSSWCAADEFELGKMHCASAAYASNLLWNCAAPPPAQLQLATLARLPQIKSSLLFGALSSQSAPAERAFATLTFARCNAPLKTTAWDLSAVAGKRGQVGRVPWRFGHRCAAVRRPDDASSKLPVEILIPIKAHCQALVFWHATSAIAGRTLHAGDQTHFPHESSDLVAVYEVAFADSRIHTLECRYNQNIAAWDASLDAALYHAPHHLVAGELPGGKPLVICGMEWRNPRADIEIRTIRLKGCARRAYEKDAPTPATLLLGISTIAKPTLKDYRKVPSPSGRRPT